MFVKHKAEIKRLSGSVIGRYVIAIAAHPDIPTNCMLRPPCNFGAVSGERHVAKIKLGGQLLQQKHTILDT